jgi:hypothetical protein
LVDDRTTIASSPMVTKLRVTIILLALAAIIAIRLHAAEPAAQPPTQIDIRDDRGNILLAADRIASYDWPTHTITLMPGARKNLYEALSKTRQLVQGIPFNMALGGQTIYSGTFTTVASSINQPTIVIVVDGAATDASLGDDKLRIQLGYPTDKFFNGQDHRGDHRLRAALRATGKLAKAPREYTQWVADIMMEMKTIERGMTRGQLLQVFETEGGIATRTERRYVHRDCPYIKVIVKFDPVGPPDGTFDESSNDKIREISSPFFEWSIID